VGKEVNGCIRGRGKGRRTNLRSSENRHQRRQHLPRDREKLILRQTNAHEIAQRSHASLNGINRRRADEGEELVHQRRPVFRPIGLCDQGDDVGLQYRLSAVV
jgi:ribosomal protein L34E